MSNRYNSSRPLSIDFILKTLNFTFCFVFCYLSSKAIVCQWVCLFVCLLPNSSETTNPNELKFWGMIALGLHIVWKKNIRIRRTVCRRIACIVGMHTSDPSGQFYSLQYESSTYLRGWKGVGRLKSDRMSYRNHYMCSGEATIPY